MRDGGGDGRGASRTVSLQQCIASFPRVLLVFSRVHAFVVVVVAAAASARRTRNSPKNLSGSAGLVALSSIIPSCSAFATVDSRYVLAESAALASSSVDGRGSSSVVSKEDFARASIIRVGPSVARASSRVASSRFASSSSRTSGRRLRHDGLGGHRVDASPRRGLARASSRRARRSPHARARAVEDSNVVARARDDDSNVASTSATRGRGRGRREDDVGRAR